jgi:hypothetical protein
MLATQQVTSKIAALVAPLPCSAHCVAARKITLTQPLVSCMSDRA